MERMILGINLSDKFSFEKLSKLFFCFFCVIFIFQLIISCSWSQVHKKYTKGVYHQVKKGETAWSIARAYHVKLQDLAEANNIEDPSLIKEDAIVFIPDADKVIDDVMLYAKNMDDAANSQLKTDKPEVVNNLPGNIGAEEEKNVTGAQPATDNKEIPPQVNAEKIPTAKLPPAIENESKVEVKEQKDADEKLESKSKEKLPIDKKEELKLGKGRFIWPVKEHTVKTRFGIQPNKTYHNWIKIVSSPGAEVKASASGTVIFSSEIKGYGDTIIIRHENDFATVYTRLKKRYVKIDQNVKKGETIALIGHKDKSGNTYMNFEIRLQGKAQNPMLFLP